MEPLSEISATDSDNDVAVDGNSDNNSSSIKRFKMDNSGITLQISLNDGRYNDKRCGQDNDVTFKNELTQHANSFEHLSYSRRQPDALYPPQDQSLFLQY